jgi:hypothetical protein
MAQRIAATVKIIITLSQGKVANKRLPALRSFLYILSFVIPGDPPFFEVLQTGAMNRSSLFIKYDEFNQHLAYIFLHLLAISSVYTTFLHNRKGVSYTPLRLYNFTL